MADKSRIAAARLLLDRGIRFTIKDAPILLRLLRLNKIEIKHLRGGTIAEISSIMDTHRLGDIQTSAQANQQLSAIALVVAVAMLNHKRKIRYLSARLAKILLWKVPATTLLEIYNVIASMNKLSDFMIITKYFSHQTQMMMSPKVLGQTLGS